MNLGGIKRPLDLRDIRLAKIQAPVSIPDAYQSNITWLKPLWQNGVPACTAHAAAHLMAILDYYDTGMNTYSPQFIWKIVKQFDGYPPEEGSDMRSILKALFSGVCDYGLLPNEFPDTLQDYTNSASLTQAMRANALPRKIQAYAFGTPGNIRQDIYQNKAVMVFVDVNTNSGNWFGNSYPILNPNDDKSGHAICAYGFDADYIYIIDSADPNVPFKKLGKFYPLRETGTVVDLPDSVVKEQIRKLAILQQIVALYQQILKLLNK